LYSFADIYTKAFLTIYMEKEALEDGCTKKGGTKSWNSSAVAHQVILEAVHVQC
jgi:hypothetical protein